jgi:hypothetical protein
MRTKFVAMLAPALAPGVFAVTAGAQQHRATRLGNPATRKWQLAGQARAPFSEFDDLENNYQLWGGFRFRPNSSK